MTGKPNSWRDYPIIQVPEYPDQSKVTEVEETLGKKPPLVFAGEVKNLRDQLRGCCKG